MTVGGGVEDHGDQLLVSRVDAMLQIRELPGDGAARAQARGGDQVHRARPARKRGEAEGTAVRRSGLRRCDVQRSPHPREDGDHAKATRLM